MTSNSLADFRVSLSHHFSEKFIIQLDERNQALTIPVKGLEFLSLLVICRAEGKAISLLLTDLPSPQRANDVSEASGLKLLELLEGGEIPFQKVGTHCRILLEDLLQAEVIQKSIRQFNLQYLAQQAQQLRLGYE